MSYSEYENMRRVVYEASPAIGTAVFVPVCSKCGRFVKVDDTIQVNEWEGLKKQPNATCKKDGRVEMLFEGFL